MRRFRFKTLEEFGGERPSRWNSIGEMDCFFGVELINFPQDLIIKAYLKDNTFMYRDKTVSSREWVFNGENLVEIKEETNMERIYKENWEDYSMTPDYIIGVEMQTGKKYFLQFNNDGVVPVNLKEHENNDFSDTTDLESILTGAIDKLEGNKKVFKFNSMQDMIAWATS